MQKLLDDRDLKRMESMLEHASNIVLTCHVRPDGDAVGSTLGLAHLLRGLGKSAAVVMPDQAPRSLAFLPGMNDVAVFSRHPDYCGRLLSEADLVICCDFNKPSRQDRLAPLVQECGARKILVDHHQDPDDFVDLMFSFPDMSSTCELVFRIIVGLGLYVDMNLDSATCLLTGLITDTRNFTVNCKNPDIYEILEKLLDKGADKTKIVREALTLRSFWSLKLESFALSERLELFPKYHGAVITLDRNDLEEFHYVKGDSEGLVNRPLEIRGITFSFFLREDSDCVKVSARSINDFPVSRICEDLFGGGGHIMAAGAEFHGSVEECKRLLVESFPRYESLLAGRTEKLDLF